jgi:hypothetical protein
VCDSLRIATDLGADEALGGGDDTLGVTKADPGVVHLDQPNYFQAGETVCFENVAGMTELNGNCYTVANPNIGARTFELSGTDTSSFGDFECEVEWFHGVASCTSGYASGWTDNGGVWQLGSGGYIQSLVGWQRVEANDWRIKNARGGSGWDGVIFGVGAGSSAPFVDNSWGKFRYSEPVDFITSPAPYGMDFSNVDSDGSPADGDRMDDVLVWDPICQGTGTGCVNLGASATERTP